MSPHLHPLHMLQHHRKMMLRGEAPTRRDLLTLWRLSGHPDGAIREAALILLSSPPVEDEAAHLKVVLHACLTWGQTCPRLIPPPVWEQLFDLWEQADATGIELSDAHGFRALLQRLPLAPIRTLIGRPYSVRPFFAHIARRLGRMLHGHRPSAPGRRWRRLARELCRQSPRMEWSQLTFTDLPLTQWRGRACRENVGASGRWLQRFRPLLFREADPAPEPPGPFPSSGSPPTAMTSNRPGFAPVPGGEASSFRKVRWGGLGNLSLSWMDALLDQQSREMTAIRALAHEVSRTTRRVVFSWHNAGLAAAGGWSFEDLDRLLPSPKLRDDLARAVRKREMALRSADPRIEATTGQLLRLRGERLAFTAIRRALREICALEGIDPSGEWTCARAREAVAPWMPDTDFSDNSWQRKHGWTGLRSPGQRLSLSRTLAWWEGECRWWPPGLIRLAALALEAQKLVTRGDLELFVLPWIDKFFISSTRLADTVYLPGLAQWIEDHGIQPLILLWEDTIHSNSPTFKLALDAMRAGGLAFRGIGVLGEGEAHRRDALRWILEAHSDIRLFALRPLDDTHHPGSFHPMLEARDYGFLARYDSSWKDNLAFPYAGTRVFPLLADAGYREVLPAWVAVGGAREPFGRFFRRALRRRALGLLGRDLNAPLSSPYACWANLR
ncbi:MAG: hypothetical protein MUF52_10900 [Syntrophobacteraceae bacterium]|nr:hypothetical protein [Syntrophobacteraceae bacterium]